MVCLQQKGALRRLFCLHNPATRPGIYVAQRELSVGNIIKNNYIGSVELLKEWESIEETVDAMRLQIEYSIPFVPLLIPGFVLINATPCRLFDYLKSVTTYYDDDLHAQRVYGDSGDVELLQSLPTLLENGGKGDCDCFTIAILAALEYVGLGPNYIVLAGRQRAYPSHVYAATEWEGKIKVLDLTAPTCGFDRNYKFTQYIEL